MVQDFFNLTLLVVIIIWMTAREQNVGNDTDGPEVRCLAVFATLEHLGRHVGRGTDDEVAANLVLH